LPIDTVVVEDFSKMENRVAKKTKKRIRREYSKTDFERVARSFQGKDPGSQNR
jgi:hypothetical protein